jgi:hypothetical protein
LKVAVLPEAALLKGVDKAAQVLAAVQEQVPAAVQELAGQGLAKPLSLR